MIRRPYLLLILLCFTLSQKVLANCNDAVVLVHGNTTSPDSWDNTVNALLSQGYTQQDLFLPDWGSKTCASCNNHYGSEEVPVRAAIEEAILASCTGKIDVIAHSMGVTLAIQQIDKLAAAPYVESFVGVAGAARGLLSCGVYPYNVWNSTCGVNGLSVQSPFLDSIYGVPIADHVYSIKSFMDQVVCSTGSCYVYGIHSSRIWNEDATYTYALGHFGLQTDTTNLQVSLISQ